MQTCPRDSRSSELLGALISKKFHRDKSLALRQLLVQMTGSLDGFSDFGTFATVRNDTMDVRRCQDPLQSVVPVPVRPMPLGHFFKPLEKNLPLQTSYLAQSCRFDRRHGDSNIQNYLFLCAGLLVLGHHCNSMSLQPGLKKAR
jgi:hypothetical protein